jgi:hypothetical protein
MRMENDDTGTVSAPPIVCGVISHADPILLRPVLEPGPDRCEFWQRVGTGGRPGETGRSMMRH